MSKNLSKLSGRKGIEDNLFDKLGQIARPENRPSKDQLKKLADEFLFGEATLYGVTTFYDFLKPDNKGKQVYVCNGHACLNAGTQEPLKKEISKYIDESQIGHMTCLGRCHENGSFQYLGHNYSGLSAKEIKEVMTATCAQPKKDKYIVDSTGAGILTKGFIGGETYRSPEEFMTLWRNLLTQSKDLHALRADTLKNIKDSRLRGRGGAGFPISIKLEALAQSDSERKFIICNADEGDPGAYSDRYLLEEHPFEVLFGMMIAGLAAGANWGILYIRGEYPESVRIIEAAIATLRMARLIGQNSLTPGFEFDFKVIKAQGSYICGEETALINSIEGQRPEIRVRPPYPVEDGLFGYPTAVNNVETLANLPFLFSDGAAFAKIGTAQSTGTKLLSLDSFFNNPGVFEVDMGTPLKTVIHELGGGFKQPVKALHIGGPLGGIVPLEKVESLTVDFESFKEHGFLLGHGSILCIPESKPMAQYLEELMDFAAYESCGKCFPCRLGTQRAFELLHGANSGKEKIDPQLFDDLLFTLEQGSLCAHGGGIPLPVKNAMKYFADELNPVFK